MTVKGQVCAGIRAVHGHVAAADILDVQISQDTGTVIIVGAFDSNRMDVCSGTVVAGSGDTVDIDLIGVLDRDTAGIGL